MSLNKDGLGFMLADVYRLMRRAFERQLQGSSLTLGQARVLICVLRREGCRQVELAELLDVQPITLARLVDQLVQAGLVERRADPADRRAYQLYLTPAAQPQLEAIDAAVSAVRVEALAGLDEAQVDALMSGLSALRDNLATP